MSKPLSKSWDVFDISKYALSIFLCSNVFHVFPTDQFWKGWTVVLRVT